MGLNKKCIRYYGEHFRLPLIILESISLFKYRRNFEKRLYQIVIFSNMNSEENISVKLQVVNSWRYGSIVHN